MSLAFNGVAVQDIQSRAFCLNLARDSADHADEYRVLSQTYTEIAKSTFLYSSVATVACGIISAVLMETVMITASYLQYALIGFAGLQIATVAMAVYAICKANFYTDKANEKEELYQVANSRAAQIAPWQGQGLISGLLSRLFTAGNPVTAYGAENVGANRRRSKYDY